MAESQLRKQQLDGVVPYTGATQTLDMGAQNIITTGTITASIFSGGISGGGGGSVLSVNGQTGVVELVTADIPEDTNLYFTADRARAAVASVMTTDNITEGSTNLYFSNERAQDAIGAMVNSTLVYTDGTPLLQRAAITGDVTVPATSNGATIANNAVTNVKISTVAAIDATKIATGVVSNAEFICLDGVTSSIQGQLDGKQNVLTGLTASIAELNFTDGVSGPIQNQLNSKVGNTGNENVAGIKTFTSIPVLPGSDPTTANQATRKAYVDTIGQMVDPSLYKNACICATTVNITLSGEQTIDTFATSATRVLVWNQTAPAENGIYISSSGAWTRASDYNTALEVAQGTSTFILDGGVNKNRLFVMNEASVTVLGTDPIGFTPLSSLNAYNPGDGILISGSDISFDPDFISNAITAGLASAYGVSLNYGSGELYAVLNWEGLSDSTGGLDTSTSTITVKNVADDVGTMVIDDFISSTDIVTHAGAVADNVIAVFDGTDGTIQDSGLSITSDNAGYRTIIPTLSTNGIYLNAANHFINTLDSISGNGVGWTGVGGDSQQSGGTNRTGGGWSYTTGAGWNGDDGITSLPTSYSMTSAGQLFIQSLGQTPNIRLGGPGSFGGGSGNANIALGLSSSSQIYTAGPGFLSTNFAVTLSDTPTPSLNAEAGNLFVLTATGNRTIGIPTGTTSPLTGKEIIIKHIASGADRTLSLNTGAGGFVFSGSIPGLTTTTSGTADYIRCIYNGTNWDVIDYVKGISASPVRVGPQVTDVQIFTSSGTWTKPPGDPKFTQIILVGGGGGGGSGRKGAAGTVRTGGGGGGPGGYAVQTYITSILGATESVVVGTGGAGGTAVSANDTNGISGTAGGITTFGTTTVWLRAGRGSGGGGGSTTAAAGGTAGQFFPPVAGSGGNSGASSSGTGAAGLNVSLVSFGPNGGGSGAGITSANAASSGGPGGTVGTSSAAGNSGWGSSLSGGNGGATATNGGSGADVPTNANSGGAGGGGGGSSTSLTAGSGGQGGLYGGGGGGGGAAVNAVGNSGAGGAGRSGLAIVITTY